MGEVTETDWAVEFEFVSSIAVIGEEFAEFDLFFFVFGGEFDVALGLGWLLGDWVLFLRRIPVL